LSLRETSSWGHSPEGFGRGPASETVALMHPLLVVESKETPQRILQLPTTGEVPAPEGHSPMLMKNRPLQTLHKPIHPGMPRSNPRMTDPQLPARPIEGPPILTPPVRKHPPDGPSRRPILRLQHLPKEGRSLLGPGCWDDPRHGIRAGRITEGPLPFASQRGSRSFGMPRLGALGGGPARPTDTSRTDSARPPG